MNPKVTVRAFDAFLASRGLDFRGVVIGGAALCLLDIIERATDDCDVLDPDIPKSIAEAAAEFGRAHSLGSDWFNGQAHDFVSVSGCLPEGWRLRTRSLFSGEALILQTLGRQDLLCTKLVALVDRGTDYEDCLALAPTAGELQAAWPFVETYEGNPEAREQYWLPLAKKQLTRLAKDLGYDVVL